MSLIFFLYIFPYFSLCCRPVVVITSGDFCNTLYTISTRIKIVLKKIGFYFLNITNPFLRKLLVCKIKKNKTCGDEYYSFQQQQKIVTQL